MYSNKAIIFRASAFVILLCFGFTSAKADDKLTYLCEVKAVAEVAADGGISSIKKGQRHFLAAYIGSKFKILKATGKITGGIVDNQSPNAMNTIVLDEGSSMQSYKIMTVFGPSPSILYIQVDDYGKAHGSGKYTFSGYRWQEFITGTCE